MKGSNKEFSKFLNSEYNDDYLEPLEDKNKKNIEKLVKTVAQQQKEQADTPNDIIEDEEKASIKKTYLIRSMILELTSQLGEDAQNCINHLKSIELVQSVPILEAYKDLHTKFETLPVLFLSVTPDSIIYLWQINKMCPYKNGTDMALDASSLALKTCPHLSFMLLAKIQCDNYGDLIDANLLGDSQLYVKTKGAEKEITIRFYNVETFRSIIKINPFKQEALANKYSHKIIIKGDKNEEDQTLNDMKISFWKQITTSKEEVLETKTIKEIPSVFKNNMFDWDFNVIHRLNSGITVLLNRYPAAVIALEDDELKVVCTKELAAGSVKRMSTGLVFNDQEGGLYDVILKAFPIKMEKITTQSLPKGYDNRITQWEHHETKCKNIMSPLLNPYLRRDAKYDLVVYNVPLSLTNPHLMNKSDQNNDQSEEKKEENIVEKIDKKRAQLKNTQNQQNSMQEKNELLKEIRADISSKIKEGQKFDKEYQEEQKKWKPKEMKAPEGVSKESLELYSEIKAEKKKLAKEREIQKADRKKGRSEKNEY